MHSAKNYREVGLQNNREGGGPVKGEGVVLTERLTFKGTQHTE